MWTLDSSGMYRLYFGIMILLMFFYTFTLMLDIKSSWSVPAGEVAEWVSDDKLKGKKYTIPYPLTVLP